MSCIYKPVPCYNPLKAPAICMCVDCCRKVLALRCEARDADGTRCGDYKHRGRWHTKVPCTIFIEAEERLWAETP